MFSNIKNPKDFYAGVILLAFTAVFVAGMFELPLGRLSRPGPGFFPLLLTILLFIFATAITLNGLRTKGEPLGPIPWRGLIMVTLPTVFFGATVKGLGFVPSLAITVLLTCMASARWTWMSAISTSVILVIFSWFIFIWGLGLPLALCGSWLRTLLLALGVSADAIPYCY